MRYECGAATVADLRERNGLDHLGDKDLRKLMKLYDIVWNDIYPRAKEFAKLFEGTFQEIDMMEIRDGMLHAPIPTPPSIPENKSIIKRYMNWRDDYERVGKAYSDERERLRWKNHEIEVYSR
jgi:hypothetical protein